MQDLMANVQSLTQPVVPGAQSAIASATGGAGMSITVNLTGERRTDGRDLKTAYDTTTRIQKRKGR